MITCEIRGADGQYETLRKMTLYDPEEKENRSYYLCDNCYARVLFEIDVLITRMRKTYDMYNKGKARLVSVDDILEIPNKYREGMVRGPIILKPCPFCGSQNLTKYRFDIGGFLYKDGCTETICENGDTFRIECDCGCKFDKCQDELFDKAEEIYTCDGKYDVEITNADLWNIMTAEWNRRVKE